MSAPRAFGWRSAGAPLSTLPLNGVERFTAAFTCDTDGAIDFAVTAANGSSAISFQFLGLRRPKWESNSPLIRQTQSRQAVPALRLNRITFQYYSNAIYNLHVYK